MRETSLSTSLLIATFNEDAAGTLFYLRKTVGDYYAYDECC